MRIFIFAIQLFWILPQCLAQDTIFYNTSGQIKSISSTDKHNKLTGQLRTYWPNGTLKRDDFFKKGRLVRGNCFNEKGEEIAHFDYYIHPQFPGGDKALYKYLKKEIRNQHCTGAGHFVTIGYLINTNGSVSDEHILAGICDEMDNEALRVVKKMPVWTPAYLDGEPVAKEIVSEIARSFFK